MNVPFAASTALLLVGLALVCWIHTRNYLDITVDPVQPGAAGPLISVCIPARNEARTILPCIEAIFAQTYPRTEVIVVDDRSTDATPDIVTSLRSRFPSLIVVHGAPLPLGWAGKPHALHQAAGSANGAWLCFVDADTLLAPEALASCYTKAIEAQADLFTILTRQLTGSFWEKVLMPIVITALSVGFPPRRVNDPRLPDAVANGQFILIRRAVYDAVGGHLRIKDQIVDDKALAEVVKWSGRRLVLADGRRVARTRMYTSLPELWEGWTKNIYLGLRDRPATLFLGAIGALLLVAAAVLLPLWPLLGLYWFLRGAGWMALAVILESLALWGVLLFARAAVAHGMGIARAYAFTAPLGSGIFAAMMLTSAWKVLSGRGVTWRGRTYTQF
jgi:chlorobactene glucosyltransferase